MQQTMRRRWSALVVGALALAGPMVAPLPSGAAPTESVEATTSAAPTPTEARLGRPTKVVAVGDSITQSTGTGALSKENPVNSWATGTGVSSVAFQLTIDGANRYNLATNGDKMTDFAPQIKNGKSGGSGDVPKAPADTGLVLVEFGGNDLCASSVGSMTTVANYRSQFQAGLAQVASQAPDALIMVMSVPDIYNLWYIRGAPQNSTYHPEPESSQASGINGARFYWGFDVFGFQFPCQSLLSNPDSYAQADRDRRAAVRTRTKEYNQVLSEECAKVLRCRFDSNRLFDLTSNRSSPPDGPLLPQAQWNFTDLDISRNTSTGCPIPGLVGGGCGDHFHPSKQGQGKIAMTAMASMFDFNDTTVPTVTATVVASPRPDGVQRGSAKVHFTGGDDRGLRGQEVRVHRPNGTVTAWSPSIGVAPDLTVTDIGTSYVEARSIDVNGNTSASAIASVTVTAAATPYLATAPVVSSSATDFTLSWAIPSDDGGSSISNYTVRAYRGSPVPSSPETSAATANRTIAAPPLAGSVVRYTVAPINTLGEGPESPMSAPTVAPFASLDGFARRQLLDFTGSAPASEVSQAIQRLEDGVWTPTTFVEWYRSQQWFDGAYGPATRLYRAYFLRNPDPSGLDYWANRRRRGTTLAIISQKFAQSSEFKRRYGSLTNAQFVDALYRNVFDRAPDPSGRSFFLQRLNDKVLTRGQMVTQFSESSEYKRKTEAIVAAVEYARGMNGRAPSASLAAQLVATYEAHGSAGVLAELLASDAYRSRVVG
ncbi:MAG: DUF4214 domain-containing protein [Acidimicrobiales bacterium]|nr:DUF4214 domain-containing protein [Acidimicrobiales bacterium]